MTGALRVTGDHRILAEYLRWHCRGRAAASPKRAIRADLVLEAGIRLSSRGFDFLAEECALLGIPVGSSSNGFFWMVDEEDFDLARSYLVCRFAPMKERIEAIERMKRNAFSARLFEVPA